MNGGIPDLFAGTRPGFLPNFRKSRPGAISSEAFSSADSVCQHYEQPGTQLKYANLGGDNMASGTIALDRAPADYSIWRVILASSVGTMIEWYDFYIFGSLAAVLSPKFYPAGNDTIALIAYLSTFAVGFLVRPFGALFFGRIGDLVGRKYAFLVTLTIMGGATALIGFLPTFATAGWFAPITLLAIRDCLELAPGVEYGGAALSCWD